MIQARGKLIDLVAGLDDIGRLRWRRWRARRLGLRRDPRTNRSHRRGQKDRRASAKPLMGAVIRYDGNFFFAGLAHDTAVETLDATDATPGYRICRCRFGHGAAGLG